MVGESGEVSQARECVRARGVVVETPQDRPVAQAASTEGGGYKWDKSGITRDMHFLIQLNIPSENSSP